MSEQGSRRCTLRRWCGLASSVVALLVVRHTTAQMSPQPLTEPSTPPKGLRVELQVGDGTRTAYHLGEVVPVRLSFTSTEHAPRWISYEPCESLETYPDVAGPKGLTTRAAEDAAALSFSICMGHGWGGEIDMAEKPWVRNLTLNHRYMLDEPGTYDLTWRGAFFGAQLVSNVARLTLLPSDSAWEAAELARAAALIVTPREASGEKRGQGCTVLRYLGTHAAELDMARRFGTSADCDGAFDTALVNAKARSEVLDILEQRIAEPSAAVSPDFLRVLALVSLYRSHPEWYAAATRDPQSIVIDSEKFGPVWRPSLLKAEELRYATALGAALPGKTPAARAKSIEWLVQMERQQFQGEFPPELAAAMRRQMPDVFLSLDDFDQRAVLEAMWPELGSAAMAPVLVGLVEHDGDARLRGQALRRLNDVAPDKARAYVLSEIREPQHRFPIEDMGILPDADVPELDPALLQHVMEHVADPQSAALHGALILLRRYASAGVEPQVKEVFDANFAALDCGERLDVMAYLHRVDPAAAESYMPKLQFDGKTGGDACAIGALAFRYWSPGVEAVELSRMDAKEAGATAAALEDLKRYASPVARAAILRSFESWHQEWKPKAALLAGTGAYILGERATLDSTYLHTLIRAYGWDTSRAEIVRLGALCLTGGCRGEADARAMSYTGEHTFIVLGGGADRGEAFNYGLAPYGDIGGLERMEAKLTQYPAGTAFLFDSRQHTQRTVATVEATLGAWLSGHGYAMTVYRDPPER